jgi:hypothetical protein
VITDANALGAAFVGGIVLEGGPRGLSTFTPSHTTVIPARQRIPLVSLSDRKMGGCRFLGEWTGETCHD